MKAINKNIFVYLCIVLSVHQLNAQFVKQNSGTNSDLNSVCFINSEIGFAGGFNGVLLRTINGGRNWDALETKTEHRINSVCFLSIDTGFIAGENGVFKRTTDGGNTWQQLISIEDADFTAIQFVDGAGYAVGHSIDGGVFCKSADNGASWEYKLIHENYTDAMNQSSLDFNDIYLMNLSFLNAEVGIIGGFKYNFTYGKIPFICKTTNGGQTFEDISPSDPGIISYDGKEVVAVKYISEHDAFAIVNNASGTEFLHLSDYRVKAFEKIEESVNYDSRGMYYTSAFLNKYVGYFSGIINGTSQIVKTTDQGSSFMSLNPPTDKSIFASCFSDLNTGYFVGEGGIILRLNDRDNVAINNFGTFDLQIDPPYSIAVAKSNKRVTRIHIYNVNIELKKQLNIVVYDSNGNAVSVKNTRVKKYDDEIRMKIKTDELRPATYFYTIKYKKSNIVNGKITLGSYAHN
jgi:photosystem II stability/assembly factor-like uncharacterized protein